MSIFQKILAGLEWFGKEVGKAFTELPKLITLTKDAETVAQDALPQVISVVQDAGGLVTASAKDGGAFLASLSALVAAIGLALESKALNIAADVAVAGAFEAFIKQFNKGNISDVLTAWHQLAQDTHTLDATVLEALKKLKADA